MSGEGRRVKYGTAYIIFTHRVKGCRGGAHLHSLPTIKLKAKFRVYTTEFVMMLQAI
jgi:hypothetical protein